MSKTKSIISILLSAIIILVSLPFWSINMLAYEEIFVDINEEKIYTNVTIEDHFSDRRVLVVFKNQESLKFKNFQATDFPEINCKSVKDLSGTYVQKIKNIMAGIQIASILREDSNNNFENVEIIKKYNQTVCLELNDVGKENVIAAIKALQERDDILYVGPDYEISIANSSEEYEPNDPYFDYDQWGFKKIELPKAWQLIEDMSYGEVHEVVVGVLDTGIDGDHPDLNEIIDDSSSRDFTGGSPAEVQEVIDDNGHGTHVAGIIGAIGDNKQYIAGTCWDVELVSLKVYDSNGDGYASHLIDAINYARDFTDIQILNFSGVFTETMKDSNGNYWLTPNDIFPLQNAIESFGGLFVCAAGNTHNNNDDLDNQRYPASLAIDNMITVGASTYQDQKRSDSNFGYRTVDLFAPGDDIYSLQNNGTCISMGGTSMAAPFVTGVAAIMLSVNSDLDASDLKRYIKNTVDKSEDGVTAFNGICSSGGRLNAYKAVSAVLSTECEHTGDISYGLYTDTLHRVWCDDCDELITIESHEYSYTSYGASGHRVHCSLCTYSELRDHNLYVHAIYGGDDGCTIKCRNCTRVFNCDCDPEYGGNDESGHWVSCPDGYFNFFEEHDFNYLPLAPSELNRLYYHRAYCEECGTTYQLAHNWETVFGGGVECSDCGLESDIGCVGDVMSLSEEELELLLSTMSEEELGEFIAALPGDALARVTAILTPVKDDELLTE